MPINYLVYGVKRTDLRVAQLLGYYTFLSEGFIRGIQPRGYFLPETSMPADYLNQISTIGHV